MPSFDLRAKKAFGQNFLVSEGAIRTIVGAALASPAGRILEIGPGPGVLTAPLLADGRPLWAVDLDPEAVDLLRGKFADKPNFHILLGDAVQVGFPDAGEGGEGPWSVVGNLPYNAATPILTRFLTEPIPWERLVFMFQLEVAQKLQGRPGEKAYGPLSVLSQLCCRLTRLVKLGPGAFRPAPKVDSAVLQFDPLPDALPLEDRRLLLKLLHRSFGHRRKTLSNNWQGWADAAQAEALLAPLGLSPSLRAEAVPPTAWRGLLAGLKLQPDLSERL
jgi:16S rRNA (adenine1518-N6/adenine1519-N6)-dimethyltransferase